MGMQIEKSFVLKAPADAVWAFLTDPRKVASCLPGAAITDEIDPRTFAGTMTVKVGPVTAAYRGKMKFERLDADAREAEIAASGQETRGKGAADMRMSSRVIERGTAETEVVIVSDVNVVGVLAQFGRGMIQDVSDQMFEKFTAAMRRQLEVAPEGGGGAAPAAAPAPATPSTPSSPSTPSTPESNPGHAAAAPAAPVASPAPSPSPAAVPKATPATAATAPTIPPSPTSSAAPPASPPRATEEVLDLGALGSAAAGRAAGRMLRHPVFWVVAALVVLALLWLLT
jgi:uncharacterized protein